MDAVQQQRPREVVALRVLEQALAQFEDWKAAGIDVPRLSVNVSALRLQDEGLVEGLKDLAIDISAPVLAIGLLRAQKAR